MGLIEKSEANWSSAYVLLESERNVNAAANRFYYSVFQAVKAFAVARDGFNPEDHKEVHRKMGEVVGKYESTLKHDFDELLGLRKQADYEPDAVDERYLKSLLHNADILRQAFLRKTPMAS